MSTDKQNKAAPALAVAQGSAFTNYDENSLEHNAAGDVPLYHLGLTMVDDRPRPDPERWPFVCRRCGAPVRLVRSYSVHNWRHVGNQWQSGTCKRPPHVVPNKATTERRAGHEAAILK